LPPAGWGRVYNANLMSSDSVSKQGERSIRVRLSAQPFDIPPMRDVLLIGRRAPIGPEAARRMAEALAPGQFDLIRLDERAHPVEAVLVRKSHLRLIAAERLVDLLLEEFAHHMEEEDVLRIDLDLQLHVERMVRLG